MPDFPKALLTSIGAEPSLENLRFLNAWVQAEGTKAAYNPLATTQPAPGATSFNPVGVRNYPSFETGVEATKQTLLNGRYGPIVAMLRSPSTTAEQMAQAVAASPWGTGEGVLRVLGAPAGAAPPAPAPAPAPTTPSIKTAPPTTISIPRVPDLTGAIFGTLGAKPSESLSALVGAVASAQAAPPLRVQIPNTVTVPTTTGTKGVTRSPVGPMTFEVSGKTTPRAAGAIGLAKEYLGTPYVWGGEQPGGFDCSGLLQYVWGKQGVEIPRVTYDQWRAGTPVPTGQLRPGDAVFFRPGSRGPEHVGMYIGEGKMIEAPRTGLDVRIASFADRDDFMGARRYG